MQVTTPGFVLTSLSLWQTDDKRSQKAWQQTPAETQSTIAKFDYCLPPEEFNYFEAVENQHIA